MSDEGLLSAALVLSRSAPPHARRSSWEYILSVTEETDFVGRHAGELSSLLLESACSISAVDCSKYHHDASTQAVRQCLKSDDFVKEFVSGLVHRAKLVSFPGTLSTLLQWSSLAIIHLDSENGKKAIDKVIECQAVWFDSLARRGKKRHLKIGYRAVGSLLATQADLVDNYIDVASVKVSGPLVKAVWSFLQTKNDSNLLATAPKLIRIYIDKVIPSKVEVRKYSLDCYTDLLGHASDDELSEIMSVSSRMIRRSPEIALSIFVCTLKSIRQNLSKFAPEFTSILLQQARHSKETVQRLAIQATKSFVTNIKEHKSLKDFVDNACYTLDGKSEVGKLKNPQERASTALMIESIASSSSQEIDSMEDIAISTSEFLCKYYPLEISDEAKVAVLQALGSWMLHLDAVIPSCIPDRFSQGLREKEVLRRAHLRALAKTIPKVSSLHKEIKCSLPSILEIIKEGMAKAAVRIDGYLALTIVSYSAQQDTDEKESIMKSEVWKQVVTPTSTLMLYSTASTLPSSEAAPMATALGALLSLCGDELIAYESTIAELTKSLALLTLHHNGCVRVAALQSIEAAVKAHPSVTTAVLEAIQHWIQKGCEDQKAMVMIPSQPMAKNSSKIPSSSIENFISLDETRKRYSCAILASISDNSRIGECDLAPEAAALVLNLSHHPTVTSKADRKKSRSSLWRKICMKTGSWIPLLSAKGDIILDVIVNGNNGIVQSSFIDKEQQTAGFGALSAIAMYGLEKKIYDHIMKILVPLLSREDHDVLSPRQLRVYATPLGRLSNENEDGSIIPLELFEEMLADKVNGFKPPLFPPPSELVSNPFVGIEMEPDVELSSKTASQNKTRNTLGSAHVSKGKKSASASKDAAAEARMKQLKSEAEIRAQVVQVRERLACGLLSLCSLAKGNPDLVAIHLNEFSCLVSPLLVSPLVGEGAALECMISIAMCLPKPLKARAVDVAASLRLVALVESRSNQCAEHIGDGEPPAYQDIVQLPSLSSALMGIELATGYSILRSGREGDSGALFQRKALPLDVYSFCFPILRGILSCPTPTPLHDPAFLIVSLQISHTSGSTDNTFDPNADFESVDIGFDQTFALMHHIIEVLPAFRDKIQVLLSKLCTKLSVNSRKDYLAALKGVLIESIPGRRVALSGLLEAPIFSENGVDTCCLGEEEISLLWISAFDTDTDNAEIGRKLWQNSRCDLPVSFVADVSSNLSSRHGDIRKAAAKALSEGIKLHPSMASEALERCKLLYSGGKGKIDGRRGSAAALSSLAEVLSSDLSSKALNFVLSEGLIDTDSTVRSEMVDAGVHIVDARGPESASSLMPIFEDYLEKKTAMNGLSEDEYDHVREGAVVFLGTLARHLDPAEQKVKDIVGTLIEVLRTPSESVQRSVSDCLPPLMKALQTDDEFVGKIVRDLLDETMHGKAYGDRRGAAFGLAGVVKGLGLSALKGRGIMEALKAGVDDKSNIHAREGALCAFECLSEKLGRLFEPYVIHILPSLLTAFGDSSPQVRESAVAASRVIMGQLSAQGVKLVLPALLKGAEDKSWRTKQGSVQLLGSMAYCAPKQLGSCLPTVVPRLGEVLADPHPKVGSAARQALEEIGSVIRNPEISRLVPCLLAALAEPSKSNRSALDTLLKTVFVNTVDAASLSLIIPVIHWGLRERSGDSKKRAARIVGNLCALVNDPKDMIPYIPILLPELQAALLDPLPEVRATAAKALGAMVKGVGIEIFPDLISWLLERISSESSAVERSGAAQGLAEVVAVEGPSAISSIVSEALDGSASKSAASREGFLTLFKYLPYCVPEEFQPHLPSVLPAILHGLADESEGVRDAAFTAGRVAVELYANSALPLLLPAVEEGTSNSNWRIRQSSVELLGDLLFKVAGTTGRIQQDIHDEESEGISVEAHGAAIIEALGMDRRNEILARLYVARSDSAYTVRSASVHVWKTIVTNTPKTLGEIMPSLMEQVIRALAEGDVDQQEAAGKCLGELVRKMGERILNQILPILRKEMESENPLTRAGVCEGLREVLENATRNQLAEHLTDLLPSVQSALCDTDSRVREAAGGAFNVLFKSGGGSVIDSVIPSLLSGLDSKDERASTRSLEGLRVILSVRPQLMSVMIPNLVKPPIVSSNLIALGALADVAGPAINTHLPTIMPSILRLANDEESPEYHAAHSCLESMVAAIDEDGLHILVSVILTALDEEKRRRGACAALSAFCKSTRLDYQEHVPSLISSLVPILAEENQSDVEAAWMALGLVTSSIPKDMAPSFVKTVRAAVGSARERSKRATGSILIPGLNRPKGLAPLLPIYLQGILQGASAELRELAADGIGEMVEATTQDSLKPFVVQITGPLIRIAGDRFPWQTKASILRTMGIMVSRAGLGLRPFVPQLQTTFLKALVDQSPAVRECAAQNIGALSVMAPRLDQLMIDLAKGAATQQGSSVGVQQAYLQALRGALRNAGDRMSDSTLEKIGESCLLALKYGVSCSNEALIFDSAGALGAYAERCPEEEIKKVLEAGPLRPIETGNVQERLAGSCVAAAVAELATDRVESLDLLKPFILSIVRYSKDKDQDVKRAAGKAAGRIIISELTNHSASKSLGSLVSVIIAFLGPDQATDVQRQGLAILRRISSVDSTALVPYYGDIVPSILAMIQDSSGTTKLATERTLAQVLQLDRGTSAANEFLSRDGVQGSVKRTLTEVYLRRLGKLPTLEEDDLGSEYRV